MLASPNVPLQRRDATTGNLARLGLNISLIPNRRAAPKCFSGSNNGRAAKLHGRHKQKHSLQAISSKSSRLTTMPLISLLSLCCLCKSPGGRVKLARPNQPLPFIGRSGPWRNHTGDVLLAPGGARRSGGAGAVGRWAAALGRRRGEDARAGSAERSLVRIILYSRD